MKTILLLTDFSDNANNAIRYALRLFKDAQIQFYMLHIKKTSVYTTDDLMGNSKKSIYNSLIKPYKTQLLNYALDLKSEFQLENNIEIIVDYDAFTSSIQRIVDSKNIDLVVMGTNGATGAKEVIFGSNTINVIRKVNCNILVIPENFKYRKPTNILLPLDTDSSLFEPAFTLGVLKFLNSYGESLHILRLYPDKHAKDVTEEDSSFLEQLNTETHYVYKTIKDIPEYYAISSYTQTQAIDLVVVMIHKARFFERYLTTSSTARISNNPKVPLLLLHEF